MKTENESYHPLRHRNAGDVSKFRTVSHGGSNTKVKKLYEAAKKVFEIGKCAKRMHAFRGGMKNEANPFKVEN